MHALMHSIMLYTSHFKFMLACCVCLPCSSVLKRKGVSQATLTVSVPPALHAAPPVFKQTFTWCTQQT